MIKNTDNTAPKCYTSNDEKQNNGGVVCEYYYNRKDIRRARKNDRISKFFQKFDISKAIKSSGFYKRKGTQPIELLKYVFTFVF